MGKWLNYADRDGGEYVYVTHGETVYDNSVIIQNGLSIDRYTAVGGFLEWGNVTASELSLTLDNTDKWFDWVKGDELSVDIDGKREDAETPTDDNYKMGVFIIDKITKSQNTVQIVALDRMIKMDIDFDWNLSAYTIPNLLDRVATLCGIDFDQDVSELPNSSITLTEIFECTCRELVSYIAEIMGCGAYMDERGYLTFGWYAETETDVCDSSVRVSGEASDVYTVTNIESGSASDARVELSEGENGWNVTMRLLSVNPIVSQLIATSNIDTAISAIKSKCSILNKPLRGMDCVALPYPAIAPYQIISYSANDETAQVAITHQTYSVNLNMRIKSTFDPENLTVNNAITPNQVAVVNEAIDTVRKHFFFTDDSGAHITEIANDYTVGRNVLVDSDSVDIRSGENIIASFGEGTEIGSVGANGKLALNNKGISLTNEEEQTVFDVRTDGSLFPVGSIDVPTVSGQVPFGSEVDCSFMVNGDEGTRFNLQDLYLRFSSENNAGIELKDYEGIRFDEAVNNYVRFEFVDEMTIGTNYYSHIVASVELLTEPEFSPVTAYLTVSYDKDTNIVSISGGMNYDGAISVSNPVNWSIFGEVKGDFAFPSPSFAFGSRSDEPTERGEYSATLGLGLISSTPASLTIGRYNEDSSAPFTIGNGGSEEYRQNIFTVDDWGNILASQYNISGSGIELTNEAYDVTTTINNYDGGSYGNELVINTGGNLIIGSGEFPENFHDSPSDVLMPDGSDIPYTTTGEHTYIGADNAVYIITNANTLSNSKVWQFRTGGDTEFPRHIYMQNGTAIYGRDTGNNWKMMLEMATSNNVAVGYGGYQAQDGNTNVYGNYVRLLARQKITANQDICFSSTTRGILGVDKTGFEYPLVRDNGTNLWIGADKTDGKQHTGSTIISAGHNGVQGNATIYISVPNNANTSATNYSVYHSGNITSAPVATTSANGLMASSDKTKLNKITVNNSTTAVALGDSTTQSVLLYGNSTNLVSVGITNTQDSKNYRILAKKTYLQLYNATDNTAVWNMSPTKFLSGETWSCATGLYQGHITSGTKEVVFFIPTPREANGLTITASKVGLLMRGISGYVDGSDTSTTVGTTSAYTWYISGGTNGIYIRVTKSSNYTNVNNNTPVTVQLRTALSFSFS